jgi:hypothetical protein
MIDGRANNTQGESFVTIEGREVKVPRAVLSQCGNSVIVNNQSSNAASLKLIYDHQEESMSPKIPPSPSRWCGVDV